jgi:hypothetical protein
MPGRELVRYRLGLLSRVATLGLAVLLGVHSIRSGFDDVGWSLAGWPAAFMGGALFLLVLSAAPGPWPRKPVPSGVATGGVSRFGCARAFLAIAGGLMLAVAAAALTGGLRDYRRLARLPSEGRLVTATVTRVEEEVGSGSGRPVGSSDYGSSSIAYMASVRYEVDGRLIEPTQRFGIDRAAAGRFRFHEPVTLVLVVLPDAPSHPYTRENVPGDLLAVFLVPLVALGAAVLCFAVAWLGPSGRTKPAA